MQIYVENKFLQNSSEKLLSINFFHCFSSLESEAAKFGYASAMSKVSCFDGINGWKKARGDEKKTKHFVAVNFDMSLGHTVNDGEWIG